MTHRLDLAPVSPAPRRRQPGFFTTLFAAIFFLTLVMANPGGSRAQSAHPTPGDHHHPPQAKESSNPHADHGPSVSADQALLNLETGNLRFVKNKPKPKHNPESIRQLVAGQHPFAIIFTCSDSRVPPELLFDAGLGELFIIRVAGNVTDINGIASAEYAVKHLGTRLIVVMGHSSCGAVKAAVAHVQEGHITDLVHDIEPALTGVATMGGGDQEQVINFAIRANILYQIRHLKDNSPLLADDLNTGAVKVLAAHYSLKDGEVQFFDETGQAMPSHSKSGPGKEHKKPADHH